MKNPILAGALLLSPLSLQAATTVYTANFDAATVGTNLPSPFVENNGAGTSNSSIFENSPGDNVLLQRVSNTSAGTTAGPANSSASIPFTDLGGSVNFSVSTSFRINENTLTNNNGSTFNISIGALGDNANLGAGNRYMLTYTLRSPGGSQPPGSLSINEVASTPGGMTAVQGTFYTSGSPAVQVGVTATGAPANVALDSLYTLTLTGVYNAGVLRLTGTLTGENGTDLTVIADDTSPRTGTNFGIRTALNSVGTAGNNAAGTLEAEFETFQVIPEPGSVALLGLGLGALGLRRKRA